MVGVPKVIKLGVEDLVQSLIESPSKYSDKAISKEVNRVLGKDGSISDESIRRYRKIYLKQREQDQDALVESERNMNISAVTLSVDIEILKLFRQNENISDRLHNILLRDDDNNPEPNTFLLNSFAKMQSNQLAILKFVQGKVDAATPDIRSVNRFRRELMDQMVDAIAQEDEDTQERIVASLQSAMKKP